MIDINDMFACGVQYGHRSCFANPKMAEYVFCQKNDLQIIDLEKTVKLFEDALKFIDHTVRAGGRIVIVGTKQVAQELVIEYGSKVNMPYVDQRWLGGMLTNFKTVRSSVSRLEQLDKRFAAGNLAGLTKKERLILQRERAKLSVSLGGVKDLHSLPEALFVLDVVQERIAVNEANKLGIAVIAVVDTNCSPEGVDYVIPGNDDALSAIRYYLDCVTSVIEQAQADLSIEKDRLQKEKAKKEPKIKRLKAAPGEAKPEGQVAEKVQDDKVAGKEPLVVKKKVVKRVAKTIKKETLKSSDPVADEGAGKSESVVAKTAKKPAAKKVVAKKPAVKKAAEKKPAAKDVKTSTEE